MRSKVVLAVAAMLMLVSTPTTAGAGTAPFTLDSFSLTRQPGESFTVTGSGCPPTGTLPNDAPLAFLLTPPTGGNFWSPIILDGVAGFVMTSAYISGESYGSTTPDGDGSFEVSLTVPLDAPAVDGYTVRALCLTLLEPLADDPNSVTPESAEASMTETGSLDVLGQTPSTTSTVPLPDDADPPAVAPSFTG